MAYTQQFLDYFARLHGIEGDFSNDPNDPGNWTGGRVGVGILKGTKYGIAANTYPDVDIENLTIDGAQAIYWRDWWLKIGADRLPQSIAWQMWQFAVNAGMGTARRALQFAVGVAQDGQVGPITLAAVGRTPLNDMLLRFNAYALDFYSDLSTWDRYGRGWSKRVVKNLLYAALDN